MLILFILAYQELEHRAIISFTETNRSQQPLAVKMDPVNMRPSSGICVGMA